MEKKWKELNISLKVFLGKNFIAQNHSSFKPADFSTNQFLAISHKSYKLFDNGLGAIKVS